MTQPNTANEPAPQTPAGDVNLSEQLAAIQQTLSQMAGEVATLRQEVGELREVPARLDRLERRLLVVGDLYRYEALHQQLMAQEWFAADRETVRLITELAGVSDLEDLSPRNIRSFPCGELQAIDRLWKTYSDGHFGFGAQVRVYQELGGSVEATIGEDNQLIERWGAALGWRGGTSAENPGGDRWRSCDELDFSLNAPRGCHPSRWWNSPYGSRMTNYFLSRLLVCEL